MTSNKPRRDQAHTLDYAKITRAWAGNVASLAEQVTAYAEAHDKASEHAQDLQRRLTHAERENAVLNDLLGKRDYRIDEAIEDLGKLRDHIDSTTFTDKTVATVVDLTAGWKVIVDQVRHDLGYRKNPTPF